MTEKETIIDSEGVLAVRDLKLATERVIKESACQKACIVGEHAVVYGAGAIAMPLSEMPVKVELGITENRAAQISCEKQEFSDELHGLIRDTFSLLSLPYIPLEASCFTCGGIGKGLGSSAALCMALLQGIARMFHIDMTLAKKIELTNLLERRFHGKPSGLDSSVIGHSRLIYYKKSTLPEIILPKTDSQRKWSFCLIDSNIPKSTKQMIEIAKPYFTDVNEGRQRIMSFDHLASLVRSGFENGDQQLVGHAMNEAGFMLDQSGIVTQNLREIISEVQKTGVLGCKVTGSGGGGYVLSLLSPDRYQEQVSIIEKTFGKSHVKVAQIK